MNTPTLQEMDNPSKTTTDTQHFTMKKILWIPIFLLLAFVGDRIGGLMLKKIVEQSQFRYTQLYTNQAEADILLVGNSRGLMFYQPHIEEMTGKRTFNICYNGLPINVARAMVEDYFDMYRAPERLVLDITMCDRLNKTLMAGFNMYRPYSHRLHTLLRDSIPKVSYAGNVSHLYRYNSEVFQRSIAYLKSSDKFWTNERTINDFLVEDTKNLPPYEITFLETFNDDLLAIKKLCQTKGTQLHFVVNPYFPAFANTITNLDSVRQVITEHTGVPVKDYSLALPNREDFSDYQHTNTAGSKKYLDQLQKDGILP